MTRDTCTVCGATDWIGFELVRGDLTVSCGGCNHTRILPDATQAYYDSIFGDCV